MRIALRKIKMVPLLIAIASCLQVVNAQTLEWQLVAGSYDATDPDGAGPAKGSVSFILQAHTISGVVNNVNTISTGWSYQGLNFMIPTGSSGPGCPSTVSNPANVVVSPAFAAKNWHFNTVNECGVAAQVADLKVFDSRAVGTFEGDPISITTTWVDLFTVTLWTVGLNNDGYVIINSAEGGSPGEFTTYAVADEEGNSYPTNSLTYSNPLRLGQSLPVGLSRFDITCTGNGTQLNWQTLTEENSRNFEIQRSSDGSTGWTSIGNTAAAGNSTTAKQYTYYDLKGGAAYYRLLQSDKDGRFTYSSVKKITCQAKQNNMLIYPVPAKNVVNLLLNADANAKVTIVLLDVSGRTMRQVKTDLTPGTNNLQINVAGLSAGEYIVKVLGSQMYKTQKVTISR